MPLHPENFELMLGGSHVRFKKRERPPLSEIERELQLENERKLQVGIELLRKLRTRALAEQSPKARQHILQEAHQFSDQMADVILAQALREKPSPLDPSFVEVLQHARGTYADEDAGSNRGIPPQYSIQNLFRATDDMLARVEEKTNSVTTPDHTLTRDEMRYVLQEFFIGTNDLTITAIEKFFQQDTRVGGILSGGSVYVELAKKIIEKYGDHTFRMDTFVIAVDKHEKKVACEASTSDATTRAVLVLDDMIDKGGTLLTALWATGEQFPNATIYSGKGTDQPGGFEKRRIEKFMDHLAMLFQDFAELSEKGRNDEALALFDQAEHYAKENGVELQRGWHIRKARIVQGQHSTNRKDIP